MPKLIFALYSANSSLLWSHSVYRSIGSLSGKLTLGFLNYCCLTVSLGMAPSPKSVYLLCYNLLQLSLWFHTLICFVRILGRELPTSLAPSPAIAAIYGEVSPAALLAQRLSWMEILHTALGLTGGGVGAAFVQALGRSAVLLVLVESCTSARQALPALILVAAAACGDVVRYTFYAANLLGACPSWLLTARYTAFLVCYPVGIVCEWLLYVMAMAEVDAHGIGLIKLPNTWNFAFDYGMWNRGVLLAYLYLGPSMFLYMLRQRRKKLGASDARGSRPVDSKAE
jgi:very-long-chain (3R)-3-hydroxyacyl-CoA dehydratase